MENENQLSKFYSSGAPSAHMESNLSVSAARAVQEVQGQVIMAKKFPRNEIDAINRIERSCSRISLAKVAQYSYPRGKDAQTGKAQLVSGPSIRLAEVVAQNWGNLDYGIRELSQDLVKKESIVEAYCWDLETNTRCAKVFTVAHKRKSGKFYNDLEDPRDIYELVANNGSRRLRACILGIVPSDVVELAVRACERTISGDNTLPLIDKVREMVSAFGKAAVSLEMLEHWLDHKIEETSKDELIELSKIYNSIKDGISKREDWFETSGKREHAATSDVSSRLIKKPEENPINDATPRENSAPNANKESAKILAAQDPEVLKTPKKEKKEDQKPSFTI